LVSQLKAPPPVSAAPATSSPEPSQPESHSIAAPPDAPALPSDAPAASSATAVKTAASHVRVAANVLNRMLFLAGESTVEASRLQSLRTLQAGLKGRQRALDSAAESLRESVRSFDRRDEDQFNAVEHFEGLAGALDGMHSALIEQASKFEEASRR